MLSYINKLHVAFCKYRCISLLSGNSVHAQRTVSKTKSFVQDHDSIAINNSFLSIYNPTILLAFHAQLLKLLIIV